MALDQKYYDRLKRVARLTLDDSLEEWRFEQMTQKIAAVVDGLKRFKENLGEALQGETGTAAQSVAQQLIDNMSEVQKRAIGQWLPGPAWKTHGVARKAMQGAKEAFNQLSPELVPPIYYRLAAVGDALTPGGKPFTDIALAALERQQNDRREAAAHQILEKMNSICRQASYQIPRLDIRKILWPGDVVWDDPDDDTSSRNDWESDYTGGGGGSGDVPRAPQVPSPPSPPSPPTVPSGQMPTSPESGLPGLPGTIQNPPVPTREVDWISTPILVPNGPPGGILPAPVTNRDDIGWRSDYMSSVTKGASAVGLAAAAGVAGVALASRLGGMSGLGSAGATGVGGLGSAGAGGVGSFGGVPGTQPGSVGMGSSPSSAGVGASGGAGAGGRSGSMMAGGGSAGSGQDQKLKRRKYKVLRIEDEEERSWVASQAAGPGSVDTLEPMAVPGEEDFPW